MNLKHFSTENSKHIERRRQSRLVKPHIPITDITKCCPRLSVYLTIGFPAAQVIVKRILIADRIIISMSVRTFKKKTTRNLNLTTASLLHLKFNNVP